MDRLEKQVLMSCRARVNLAAEMASVVFPALLALEEREVASALPAEMAALSNCPSILPILSLANAHHIQLLMQVFLRWMEIH